MSSKTPSKIDLGQFIPKEIQSPTKDQPGISKIAFAHVSKLHGLLSDWSRMTEKGIRLLRAISALKLHEFNNEYYPSQLKPLMENFVEILDSLKNVMDGVTTISRQLQALSSLQPDNTPLISTWSIKQISDNVDLICSSLVKEYQLKQVITENIAHCRDEHLIEVYVSSWEFEPYFDNDLHSYLFAEVGLSAIST